MDVGTARWLHLYGAGLVGVVFQLAWFEYGGAWKHLIGAIRTDEQHPSESNQNHK